MSTRPAKHFRPCCHRTLGHIFGEYSKTGLKPTNNFQICTTTECNKEFKLYPIQFSIKEKAFLFVHNGWWYMYDSLTDSVESFFPIMEVYNKDTETFVFNLVKEDLLSEQGQQLIFGKLNQQTYVQQVMVVKKTPKEVRDTITDDFNMIKMCRIFWDSQAKESNIVRLKNLALSIVGKVKASGREVVAG